MTLSVKSQSGILFVLLSMHGPSAHREHGFVPMPLCFLCLGILSVPPLFPHRALGKSGGTERMLTLGGCVPSAARRWRSPSSAGVVCGPGSRPDNRLSVGRPPRRHHP